MDERELELWDRYVEATQRWEYWKRRAEDVLPRAQHVAPGARLPRWILTPENLEEAVRVKDEEEDAWRDRRRAFDELLKHMTKQGKVNSRPEE